MISAPIDKAQISGDAQGSAQTSSNAPTEKPPGKGGLLKHSEHSISAAANEHLAASAENVSHPRRQLPHVICNTARRDSTGHLRARRRLHAWHKSFGEAISPRRTPNHRNRGMRKSCEQHAEPQPRERALIRAPSPQQGPWAWLNANCVGRFRAAVAPPRQMQATECLQQPD